MKKLFGTDGIRGVANQYPMTPLMAMKTGMAVATFVKDNGYRAIVIGKDTRMSGDMIESALAAGITSAGIDALICGVIPTPGVAFLTADIGDAGAGIVISASHNPWQDNGIKLFNSAGKKLADREEERLETEILSCTMDILDSHNGQAPEGKTASGQNSDSRVLVGRVRKINDSLDRYAQFLRSGFIPFTCDEKNRKKHFKIVVDCSHGAASCIATKVFDHEMFDATIIFNSPDGKNINESCGSQHTDILAEMVLREKADVGLAFDGDADRLIAIDEKGDKITGDGILAVCAKHALDQGELVPSLVVSTVMSNIGLSKALNSLGIEHQITAVGDREVVKKMAESGGLMGGEDSGHMIFSKYHTTGDGLMTALRLIEVMAHTGVALSELASIMTVYPQVLMNVTVNDSSADFMAIPEIAREIRTIERALDKNGRVLVRYSGTQPLLRVMVEGPDLQTTHEYCGRICDRIREKML